MAIEKEVTAESLETKEVKSANEPTPVSSVATKGKSKGIFVVLALLALCCLVSIVTIILVFVFVVNKVNNSPETKVAKEFFAALNDGDEAKVKEVSDALLYDELYYVYSDGTIADSLKNNIVNVEYSDYSTDGDVTILTVKMDVTDKQEIFDLVTRVDLVKSGDNWLVSYIGPDQDESPEISPEYP